MFWQEEVLYGRQTPSVICQNYMRDPLVARVGSLTACPFGNLGVSCIALTNNLGHLFMHTKPLPAITFVSYLYILYMYT